MLFMLSFPQIVLERLLCARRRARRGVRPASEPDSCGRLGGWSRQCDNATADTALRRAATARSPGREGAAAARPGSAPCTSSSSMSLYALPKKLSKSQKQYRIQLRKYRVNHMAWVARVGCIFLQTKKGLRVEGKEKKPNFPADEAVVWRQ